MGKVGKNPGLLGRIPGFKQLSQARALKGMNMEDMFPVEDPMGAMGGQGQRKQMRAFDRAKVRKKAKLARQQRKKQKKKKKKK